MLQEIDAFTSLASVTIFHLESLPMLTNMSATPRTWSRLSTITQRIELIGVGLYNLDCFTPLTEVTNVIWIQAMTNLEVIGASSYNATNGAPLTGGFINLKQLSATTSTSSLLYIGDNPKLRVISGTDRNMM